jgi:hypothetical protein
VSSPDKDGAASAFWFVAAVLAGMVGIIVWIVWKLV